MRHNTIDLNVSYLLTSKDNINNISENHPPEIGDAWHNFSPKSDPIQQFLIKSIYFMIRIFLVFWVYLWKPVNYFVNVRSHLYAIFCSHVLMFCGFILFFNMVIRFWMADEMLATFLVRDFWIWKVFILLALDNSVGFPLIFLISVFSFKGR